MSHPIPPAIPNINQNVRPKIHIAHNNGTPDEASPVDEEKGEEDDDDEGYFEVELKVDEALFEGDTSEIVPGKFVSFRYIGEYNIPGPPVNPKISIPHSSFLRFFIIPSLFYPYPSVGSKSRFDQTTHIYSSK